ncbi:phenylacetate--CoA ligase family protein [Amycolatopsis sp. FDAARGOS 1241]|uniref:phenylacetate--CoA ligase family protein n=1 Tax=Amycolatopsis sp. FDAARGOS 1241 TaxID=2778070 RepID=UPI001EF18CC0|nr:phenylacetate--CoA ligase family protein [Amycolatopsis sp. FDAARGOS 1241]
MMGGVQPDDVIRAYRAFFAGERRELDLVGFFRDVAATVPAYRKFLAAHGIDPASIRSEDDFRRLPLTSKATYQGQYALPELCRGGRLDACDLVAVSSGSSGSPTIWPRSLADELHIAERFEQVFRTFAAHERSTLAVVCFPLGTWVGGLFTTACVRHLAAKGFPITTVAPGNNKAEILRVLPELAPHFDQVVLLGYPPFVKDVVDSGDGWAGHAVKMVFAGEVFSEEWRDLVAARAGVADPVSDMVSLYGTADAGVLGTETPASVSIRRFLAARPELARELFGDSRLPTLVQYDPASRFFETDGGTLLFSGDNGAPLIRYHIADEGGVVSHAEMLEFCAANAFTPAAGPDLPFVFLFGRSLFTVSYFGANVYPENVTVGLEQPGVSDWVTGKFVLETYEDADRDRRLRITVELAPGREGDAGALAASIRDQLLRLNSEFAHYVPAERQLPEVVLRPAGDPEYFPVGVKHRYTRGT